MSVLGELQVGTTVLPVSSANASGTATASFALADHAHAGIVNVAIAGNTAGASQTLQGSLVVAAGNNATLSATTGPGAMTITINGPGTSWSSATTGVQAVGSVTSLGSLTSYARADHAHSGLFEVNVAGNTSGNSQSLHGSLVLAGQASAILSVATAPGAMTVTVEGWPTTSTQFPFGTHQGISVFNGIAATHNLHAGLFRVSAIMPAVSSLKSVIFQASSFAAWTMTGSITVSMGVYSADTVNSSFVQVGSGSVLLTANLTTSTDSTKYTGRRSFSLPFAQTFSLHPTNTYAFMANFSTSGSNMSLLNIMCNDAQDARFEGASWGDTASSGITVNANLNLPFGTCNSSSSALPAQILYSAFHIAIEPTPIPIAVLAT